MSDSFFIDSRDNRKYKVVEISGKIWLAENLHYEIEDSWVFNDINSHNKNYGRLYTWDAARKACPPGWTLPSVEDWKAVIETFGGYDSAFLDLTEGGNSGLELSLGGYRDIYGKYGRIGALGTFWAAEEWKKARAYGVDFDAYYEKIEPIDSRKDSAKSVRCIKKV